MQDQLTVPPGRTTASAARPAIGRRLGPWLVVALLLTAMGVGALWLSLRPSTAVRYLTAPATQGPVTRVVSATGTVNPQLTIIVGSYVSGVIQSLFCDYNTRVKAGQVCAKIDARPYQAVVDQDAAALGVAKAQLEKDRASLEYARLSERRTRTLAGRDFATKDAADNARSVLDQARAQVTLDEAEIVQRQAELDAARVNLGYTDILSPVDGTVVSRNVTQGQTVAASYQTPTLFLIATDLTRMQVDTNVSESDIGSVVEGTDANFTVDAFPKRVFEGKVTQVRQSPQTVQNVVTYDAVITVDNTDLALKPGMTASTRIVVDRRKAVLRVPNQALRYAPAAAPAATGARVFVLADGRPVARRVTTGLDDDTYTEIVAGELVRGDAVVIGEESDGDGTGRR